MSHPSPAPFYPRNLRWLVLVMALAGLTGSEGLEAQLSKPHFRGQWVEVEGVLGQDVASFEALARELEAAAAEMAPRVPVKLSKRLRVAIEPDYLAQIRATDAVGEAVAGDKSGFDLHLVAHPKDGHAYRFTLAQALLRRTALPSQPPWVEAGAALWLSREWFGRIYDAWLPELAAAHVLPSAAELLAHETQRDGSALLWTPVAAALVERLPGATLAAKRTAPVAAEAVAAWLSEWARLPALSVDRASRRPLRFQRGVSLAMLNSLESGYHAPSVDAVLMRLAKLGADSVAIMPFAGQREPNQPRLSFFNRSPRGETEIGCLHAARRAQAAGMSVLWKPHLWVGHDSWPGEVEMTTEDDWRAWWTVYRRYILHHAFLARWAEADLFAVGVELDKTAHRREWVELVADVRRFFPGPLTYASNWYGGLEKIPFWKQLDYVGVDAYFPLSSSPSASDRELEVGAQQVVARLATLSGGAGKPLLLTEVGFAAHQAAWAEPHTEGGPYSEADQARSYRALLKALEGRKWLAGLWLWKTFSGAEERMGPEADFRFLGRAAEGEIARFFRVLGASLVK